MPRPRRTTPFPYTTLFRSRRQSRVVRRRRHGQATRRGDRRDRRVNPPVASSRDRKSTRLNSSHTVISYAVFCLKKKIASPRRVKAVSVKHGRPYLNPVQLV